ncbi:hypothetical protein FGG08_004248 [Glutinoglossum americanum]|uniref:Carbohydrate kinase PfkB domain-containing protein n=1 Tax=Glutinoglossum americanum TaxID=1670608 RepID=A0A9P8I0S8_9PEZI|nr:hypothetical protein FGG08_004248 [Glutinoglossum americanum]
MKYMVAVGACYLDTILTVEDYPVEDEKLRASCLVRRRGGNCPNTVEVLQQFLEASKLAEISLVLFAVLPSRSSIGSQQITSSFEPTVDLAHCLYREEFNEPASSYIIKSRAKDSRTIVNFNDLPEMTSDEFVGMANELGSDASFVEAEKPSRAGLQELATKADVVFYSKSWAQGNGYATPEDCLRAQAALIPNAYVFYLASRIQADTGVGR